MNKYQNIFSRHTTIKSISMTSSMCLQYLSTTGQRFAIVRWLMGGIESMDYGTLSWLAAIVLPVTNHLLAVTET